MASQPMYCIKCYRADNGDGKGFRSHEQWSDEFLTEAVANIIKRGRIRHIICEPCEKAIRSRGNRVRRTK